MGVITESGWSGRSGYMSFEFIKRSQRPKLKVSRTVLKAYGVLQLRGRAKKNSCTPTRDIYTQATEWVTIQWMQIHVIPHEHMHTDEYILCVQYHTHTYAHSSSIIHQGLLLMPWWALFPFTLSTSVPPHSEWMTFETNRNAGCEDCLNRIYCQKAKPRWKPAKMSAVARQGSSAFPPSPEADLNVCVLLCLSSLLFFSFPPPLNIIQTRRVHARHS